MPGPPPKKAQMRQRRNKTSTATTLVRTRPPRKRAPSLPKRYDDKEWHRLTRAWWRDVWRSPMAAEFLEADKHALFRLAALVDKFWRRPTKDLAAEIRLEQQAFGLTPIDRRRLQWQVADEEDMPTRKRTRQAVDEESPADDPRKILKMVNSR